jgi:hypothetical protein
MVKIGFTMNHFDSNRGRGGFSVLLQSYAAELRAWGAKLAARYAVAAAILIAGVLAVFASAAVGLTALFHFVALRYGTETAYASIGGGLLLIGIFLLLVGLIVLRRRVPALPRPRRQAQLARDRAKGMIFGSAASRLLAGPVAKADPVTQVLVGIAATMLVGWIVAARFSSLPPRRRVKQ